LWPKTRSKILAEMLVKQNSIFCPIYFTLVPFQILSNIANIVKAILTLAPWAFFAQPKETEVNFTNIFGAKAEALLRRLFLILSMATEFHNNVPKYNVAQSSCGLKRAVKFWQKCWWNRTASFVQFTLCSYLFELWKLVGEIDSKTWSFCRCRWHVFATRKRECKCLLILVHPTTRQTWRLVLSRNEELPKIKIIFSAGIRGTCYGYLKINLLITILC